MSTATPAVLDLDTAKLDKAIGLKLKGRANGGVYHMVFRAPILSPNPAWLCRRRWAEPTSSIVSRQ
jgi:hypothetical protein